MVNFLAEGDFSEGEQLRVSSDQAGAWIRL